jgi:hypothetical protein
MCYGVARPEPTGREFAGFESVDGGVRGISGLRNQLSASLADALCARWVSSLVLARRCAFDLTRRHRSLLKPITADGSPRSVGYTSRVSFLVPKPIR